MNSPPEPIRVRIFTQTDESGASARLRAYAYKPHFEREGFEVTMDPANTVATTAGYSKTAARRLAGIRKSRKSSDVFILQRDFVNHLSPWIERLYARTGIPIIFDVDDAIDLRPPDRPPTWRTKILGSSDKLKAICELSVAVVAGNDFLGAQARRWCQNVSVIPTCLDLAGYPKPEPRRLPKGRPVVIGWIGSPLTTPYLAPLEPVLERLAQKHRVLFRTVGASALCWPGVPMEQRPWSARNERTEVASFDIGVMPLTDDIWSKAKCGTKLIQYMAAGVPAIASPVGMNVEAADGGRAALLVSTEAEWLAAFERLVTDPETYAALAAEGRRRAEKKFDLRLYVSEWTDLIREAVRR